MKARIAQFAAGFLALAVLLGGIGILSKDTANAGLTLAVSSKYAVKDGTFVVTIVDTETSGVSNGTASSPTTVNVTVKNKNRNISVTMTPKDASDSDASTFTMTVTVKEVAAAVTTSGSEVIPGFEGDEIEIIYSPFSRTVLVDNILPTISGSTPSKGAVAKVGSQTFSANITDTGSGFNTSSSKIDDFSATHGKLSVTVLGAVISGSDLTYAAIDDGWNVSYSVSLGSSGSDVAIPWSITAIDRAGNTKTLARTATADSLRVDGKKPVLSTTFVRTEGTNNVTITTRTGAKWDPTKLGVSDPTTSSVYAGNRAKFGAYRKNILAAFEEAGGLDAGTIEPADFTVAGSTVTGVTVVDILEDSETAPSSSARRPQEVFLTLADNLASDAKPKVSVVGTIKDKAGNSSDTVTIKAADGIPPKFTLSMNRTYHKKDATVTITTDETLLEPPTVTVTQQTATSGTIAALSGVATVGSTTATGAKTYTAKISIGTAAAKLNVQVTGNDVLSNSGTGGKSSSAATGATVFQLDNVLNDGGNPEFTVAGTTIVPGVTSSIEAVDPLLVTVAFNRTCSSSSCASGGEKTEYSGDSHKKVTIDKTTVKAVLSDGTSQTVAATVSTADSITYTLAISNPPIGTYTITMNATDEAGNVSIAAGATTATELSGTFKVIKPKAVKIAMNPGWNLISVPFSPANPAINSVIDASHPASLVMAYDNVNSLWQVSRRDADTGLFVGDVTTMGASSAYFVYSDSLEPIAVLRPSLSTASAAPPAPPAVAVSQGWNLVPILSNTTPLPKGITADSYFGTLVTSTGATGWLKALVWKTNTQTWHSISPSASVNTSGDYTDRCGGTHSGAVNAQVCIGEGVWIWSTVNSVIIP
jgi:hypothetical protein